MSFLFAIGILAQGCSDYNLHKKPTEPTPEIEVSPLDHDFGALNGTINKLTNIHLNKSGKSITLLSFKN